MPRQLHRTARTLLLTLPLCAALGGACGDDGEPARTDTGFGNDAADSGGQAIGDTDMQDYACNDPAYVPGACAAPVLTTTPAESAQHIAEPTEITYDAVPPNAGNHRGQWARWGNYAYLPPQRYLHNLEHGGIAFLYNPCAPAELIAELHEAALAAPDDDGGTFRYVMTPYPGLPTAIAVLAWENTYAADCVDNDAITLFIESTYRHAPEDISANGSYDRLWTGNDLP